MSHALTFGRYKFTKIKDGTIRVEHGTRSCIIPRDAPFTFADLQRLAQRPQTRQLLTRYLIDYMPVS